MSGRDFIDASRGDPDLEKWSIAWVDRIARLYYLNEQRLLVREDPKQWPTRQLRLEKHVERIASQRDKELVRPRLAEKAQKVLESLVNHWEGLCRFIQNPDIPMDNNIAEQTLRGPVGWPEKLLRQWERLEYGAGGLVLYGVDKPEDLEDQSEAVVEGLS